MNKNVYNRVGSLSKFIEELNKRKITRLKSINDVFDFKENHTKELNDFIEQRKNELDEEINNGKNELAKEKKNFENIIETRKIKISEKLERIHHSLDKNNQEERGDSSVFIRIENHLMLRRSKRIKRRFDIILMRPFHNQVRKIKKSEKHIDWMVANFDQIIETRSKNKKSEIDYIVRMLKEFDPIFYGAVGEIKAVKELSNLPETYHIINDFKKNFDPPIYNKKENYRIYSVQIDHIVIGPSGVFLIETKNWNDRSVNNLDLFSPVKQLKRAGFAIFVLLNNLVAKNVLKTFKLNWGDKKICTRNVLLMTNASTKEKFQFVEVTTLKSINDYILKCPVCLEEKQIQELMMYFR